MKSLLACEEMVVEKSHFWSQIFHRWNSDLVIRLHIVSGESKAILVQASEQKKSNAVHLGIGAKLDVT